MKYIIKFLGLLFCGYSPSSTSWVLTLSTTKGPWPHRGRGEMAMAYDGHLRWLGFTMYPRVSGGTPAAYARRHLF